MWSSDQWFSRSFSFLSVYYSFFKAMQNVTCLFITFISFDFKCAKVYIS